MEKGVRTFLAGTALVVSQVAVILGIAETILRLSPTLVSPAFLDRYPAVLKAEIAKKINLPTGVDYIQIPSHQRMDKGVDLFLSRPNTTYFTPADATDAAAGALNQMVMDDLGFCNPKAKHRSSVSVVLLGGSLPNCAGVSAEDNFTEQLQALTGHATYNLAVGGTGPFEFVEILKRFGLKFKPSVVVMAYSLANEVRDCRQHLDHLANKGQTPGKKQGWGFPFSRSYALSFLKAGVEVAVRQVKAMLANDFRFTVVVRGKYTNVNIRNGDRDELESALDMANGKLSPALCEPALEEFAKLGRAHGFKAVVMATPAVYGTYESSVMFNDPRWGAVMADYGSTQRRWLAENATRLGYVFIDPTSAMQAKAQSSDLLYFPSNAHLTISGHRALAEAAAPLILKAVGSNP